MTAPVLEALLAFIDRTVVDEVLVDDLQLLSTLPVGRRLPDDALQPPGFGQFDVPAQLGLLLGIPLQQQQLGLVARKVFLSSVWNNRDG